MQIVIYISLFVFLYFEVFLLITFFENTFLEKKKAAHKLPTVVPSVAVIVPCWNRENTVSETINSLLALNYPKNKLQIVAVNDGSTDDTHSVLECFSGNSQITIIHKEHGGKHSAMNEALKHTDAEFVGCLDADSYVERDALMHIIATFEDPEVAAVTPSIKVHNAQTILQLVQKAEYSLAVFVRKTFTIIDSLFITPGPFSFYRRSVIDEIGPWRYAHGTEDLEICLRLQSHHKKIANEPLAVVLTTTPRNMTQLFHQRVRWTYGLLKNAFHYHTLFFNPRYGALGMFILPLSVISLFTTLFFLGISVWNIIIFLSAEVVRLQTVGISIPAIHFDFFFFDTNIALSISIILILMTLLSIGLGRRMTKDSFISYDMPIFIALYSFLTPLWLTASFYKVLTSKSIRWR